MHSSTLSDVIIFSARAEVVKLASDHLKMKGVSNIVVPETADECVDALNRFHKALLIVDWDMAPVAVVKVLAHNRKRYAITGRPLLIIASAVSEKLVATAAEYAVSQIFTEQLTLKNLGARLGHLILAEGMADDVRKTLHEVSDKRLGGDHKSALQLLQKTLGKHPTNLRIKCEAAETLLAMGETDKAIALLAGMDKAKPPYLRGMHLYGRACMKLGRFEDALDIMERANLYNPHDAARLVDIGQALLNVDRIGDASKKFDAALDADDDLHEAHVGKAQVELMEGRVNEALAILKEVSGDLEMASVFNTCAVLNMRHGRHEAGMSLYQAALRSLGKEARLQARLYFNMGIGFRRWTKKDKALECFETAQRLDPTFKKAATQIAAIKNPAAPKTKGKGDLPGAREEVGSGLLDMNTDLASLLDDDLEENLFDDDKKKGA